jgi:hypothetical protein
MSDPSLSEIEVTALMQISVGAKLDPKHRAALHRLFHLRLIDEGAGGMRLTPLGQKLYEAEAGKLGDHERNAR